MIPAFPDVKRTIMPVQQSETPKMIRAMIYREPSLNLNLGLNEYLTAVNTQPKPLIIPLCAELPLPEISPLDVYTGTRKGSGFLLESMEGSEKIARYSFIGIDPEFVVSIGNEVDIQGNETVRLHCAGTRGNQPGRQDQVDPLPVQLRKRQSSPVFRGHGRVFRVRLRLLPL